MSKHIVNAKCPECGRERAKWIPTKKIARCLKCKTIVPCIK